MVMQYEKSQRKIKKIVKSMSGKYSRYDIFRDFIVLAACAISNQVDKLHLRKREELYMKTIKKYEKNEANKFSEILALVATGLGSAKMGDFIGELYMSMEFGNRDSGQFFTPYNVSKTMAGLLKIEPNEKGIIELNEPTCGSGGMIVALAEILKCKGVNYQKKLRVVCNDIDYNVVKMCYIQLSLLGIDAVVYQGDTITLKMNEVWITPMHAINHARDKQREKTQKMVNKMRELINSKPKNKKQQIQKTDKKPVTAGEQLSIFGVLGG